MGVNWWIFLYCRIYKITKYLCKLRNSKWLTIKWWGGGIDVKDDMTLDNTANKVKLVVGSGNVAAVLFKNEKDRDESMIQC